MDNKEFAKNLEKRTRKFAIMIIKLSAQLSISPEQKAIRFQISKSGTSIGANYREANRSKSKADFINKIRIAEGEASETVYWLEIIRDMNWVDSEILTTTLKESKELLAIFASIYNSTKYK